MRGLRPRFYMFLCSLANALDDLQRPRPVSSMTLRRAALWIVLNTAVVLCAAAWTVARSSVTLTGANGAGRGGVIPVGTLVLSVLGALVVVNLAWIAFVVSKR